MKKDSIIGSPVPLYYHKKLILTMKLTVVLLLVSVLQVSAKAFSQTSFNISKSGITLEQLFDEVEKSSDYSFFYKDEEINKREKVNVNAAEASIEELLDEAFSGKNIAYTIRNTNIVLSKKAAPTAVPASQPVGITVTGTVRDTDGGRLTGVTIVSPDTGNATISDLYGEYQIRVSGENAELQFSLPGFKTLTVTAGRRTEINVTLEQEVQKFDDIVVVGYGTQKKTTVVGSLQSINVDNLRAPSSNLSTSFAGQLSGVIAVQRSGEPGADGADFWIRGISTFSGMTSPLIIIDGVKALSGDLNAYDPEMIESFSILKDATATALYGSRGANGVMIVTTKSGRDLDKPHVNIRLETSYTMPSRLPKFVDGVQYMEMFNEAVGNRGVNETLYSADKIYGTRIGANPYVFPNIDWYEEMFRDGAINQNVNVSIRGGGRKMDYFSSVSFHNENGMLKSADDFSYNNDLRVQRYVLQNNFNVNITKTTKLSVKLNAQLRDYHGSHESASSIFSMVMNANPVDFPIRFPDDDEYGYIRWGSKSGGNYDGGYRNPYTEMVRGYQDNFQSTIIGNVDLNQNFDFITKGLSASALFSFKNWSSTTTTRSQGYNRFEISDYTWNDDKTEIVDYTARRFGTEVTPSLGYSSATTGDRQIYIQAMINYDRSFGEKHNVTGMLVYNQEEFSYNNPGSFTASLPQRKQGLAGRLTYAYDFRYLFEANFGYNGSENFAKGHRFGFFPSVGAGYVISNEKFFEPAKHIVSNLKIRASWGLVGNDRGDNRFMYLPEITLSSADLRYITGRDQNYTQDGPDYIRFGNDDLQWEVGEKINLGLDLGFWNESLNISVDVFRENRTKIFMERQSVPDILGFSPYDRWMDLTTTTYGNLGAVKNWGVDFSLDFFKSFSRDFSMSFKGTFTFARNRVTGYDEPDYLRYPNLSRVGHPLNTYLMYTAERLFIDEAEIAASPSQSIGGTVLPGDIKYSNIADAEGNYDNIIDSSDRVYSKYSSVPEIVYGFGPTFRYKRWDFSFFFQGAANVQIMMSGFHPFGTSALRNVLQFIGDDYWSMDNPDIYASYPRLSTNDMANNTATSTYWLRNGAYLKLKNVELGFNHRIFRVYMRATNLFTLSPFKYWDPEQGGGNGLVYPTQKYFNLGIQFSFNK